MNVLYDIRDTLRHNLVSVLAIVLIALILGGYLYFTSARLLPQWTAHRELAAQVQTIQNSLNDNQRANQASIGALPAQVTQAATQLEAISAQFLSEAQAATILDNFYRYAAESGVTLTGLQAQTPPQESNNTLYELRAFALQVDGPTTQLLAFLSRLQEAAWPGVILDGVNLTETTTETGVVASLHLNLSLYTSPLAVGEGATAVPATIPLATAVPTPQPNRDTLLANLDAPWAAGDWPTVIHLLTQILLLSPDDTDMQTKLYAAYINHGYTLAGAQQTAAAQAAFVQALTLRPDGAEALLGLQSITQAQNTAVTPTPAAANPTTHTVSQGETLFSIAQRYGVTVAALRTANTLTSDTIHPGQQLLIP